MQTMVVQVGLLFMLGSTSQIYWQLMDLLHILNISIFFSHQI